MNRLRHYFGSPRHFLKAIYDDSLLQEGYKVMVYPLKDSLQGFECININTNAKHKTYKITGDSIRIVYKTDTKGYPLNLHLPYEQWRSYKSTILPTQNEFVLRENGTSPNVAFEIKGVMGQKRMVNSLPENYKPQY